MEKYRQWKKIEIVTKYTVKKSQKNRQRKKYIDNEENIQ